MTKQTKTIIKNISTLVAKYSIKGKLVLKEMKVKTIPLLGLNRKTWTQATVFHLTGATLIEFYMGKPMDLGRCSKYEDMPKEMLVDIEQALIEYAAKQ